ncbi:hypothetical protein [Ornithinimicrobium kibberense]
MRTDAARGTGDEGDAGGRSAHAPQPSRRVSAGRRRGPAWRGPRRRRGRC